MALRVGGQSGDGGHVTCWSGKLQSSTSNKETSRCRDVIKQLDFVLVNSWRQFNVPNSSSLVIYINVAPKNLSNFKDQSEIGAFKCEIGSCCL